MSSKRRETRELVGFTFAMVESESENWITRAREFRDAAVLVVEAKNGSLSFPYYYNAALSLELSLKAILVSRKKTYPTTHRLKVLSDAAGVVVEKDQEKTLEILSESISWLCRYPIPNSEGRWNNFHDVLLPKHKVVKKKVSRVMKNEKTFPTLKNYLAIWKLFESEYSSIKPAGA
ncbi:MAG: HEPN domain-containing protein [Nitrospira sp.]